MIQDACALEGHTSSRMPRLSPSEPLRILQRHLWLQLLAELCLEPHRVQEEVALAEDCDSHGCITMGFVHLNLQEPGPQLGVDAHRHVVGAASWEDGTASVAGGF